MEKFNKKDQQLIEFLNDLKDDSSLLPDVKFVSQVKTELWDIVLAKKKAETKAPGWTFLPPRVVRVFSLALILIFLFSSGLVLAAGQSLPTSPLYPVKIASEKAALWLASGEIEHQIRIQQLENRLDEIEKLTPEQSKQQLTALELFLEQYEDLVDLYPQQKGPVKLLKHLDNVSSQMVSPAQQVLEKHPLLGSKKELAPGQQKKEDSSPSPSQNNDNTSSNTPFPKSTPKPDKKPVVKGKAIKNVTNKGKERFNLIERLLRIIKRGGEKRK